MKTLEVGVCSWSLDRHDIARSIEVAGDELGLNVVQIGFFTAKAVRTADAYAIVRAAGEAGVTLASSFVAFDNEDYSSIARIAATGGYALDSTYATRRALTCDVADLTVAVGGQAVAVHIGTVPNGPASPGYTTLVKRVREVADALGDRNLRLHIETGRESSKILLGFISAVGRSNVAVNFDPANFVVYGTDDAAEAVSALESRIEGVHMKDALRSARPGVDYGRPAPLGLGDAGVAHVLSRLRATGYQGPLLIECSSRDTGLDTVRSAVEYLRSMLG